MYKMIDGVMTKIDAPPKPTESGMAALNERIAALTAELDMLTAELGEKDKQIAALTAELSKKK